MRGDVGVEVGMADDLLINLDLFGQAQIVRHLDHDDAVEDRLVGVVGLEFLPLGLVRVRHDHRVDVDHAVAAGAGITFSCVAVIIACRYSISFLNTSMNSTMPRLPTLSAPLRSRTRGSPSE